MAETQKTNNQIGDFLLVKKLGEGGMGAVYKARQLSMDRDVALKILPKHLAKDGDYVDRFYREARASAKLDHVNIVRGIAVGEDRGFHYFAMEYIDGVGCEKLLAERGQIAVADAVRIAIDVARALEHAHSKGMVHRDIKPENVMITRDGTVKLADLGLAKGLDVASSLTQTGSGFGTPYYMPPEQARNAKYVDHRSDIYALGATLYHLLTGQVPFSGETAVEVLTAKEERPHQPARRLNAQVPEILDLVLDKMLARDPKDRFQTATELIAALERTGLAAAALASSAARTGRPAKLNETAPTSRDPSTEPANADASNSPAQYFLRYKDRTGKLAKATGEKHQIRELIRKGLIGTEAEAAKNVKGPYRPLLAFPEFSDLMKSRFIKEKGDQALGGMAKQIEQFDKEHTRRQKMRRIKAIVRQVLSVVIVLVILAVAAFFGWRFYEQRMNAPPSQPANTKASP